MPGEQLNDLLYDAAQAITNSGQSITTKINQAGQTGWISGGTLSAGTTNLLINISAGTGQVMDFTNPVNPAVTSVAWSAFTDYAPTIPANTSTIGIGIDSTGSVVEFIDGIYTQQDFRDYIILGIISINGGVIVSTNSKPGQYAYNSTSVDDFLRGFGPVCLEGNVLSPNGANLKLDKSEGKVFNIGINAHNDPAIPSVIASPAQTAPTMALAWRDATDPNSYNFSFSTDIDPNQYDDGSGTLAAMPIGDFTIQVAFLFGTLIVVYYGQETYGSRNAARNALRDNQIVFEERAQLSGGSYLGAIVIGEGQTDLTDSQVLFFGAPCLRRISRGWGGTAPPDTP